MDEVKIISWEDTKIIENDDGSQETVAMFIPTCCREGWEDCPHVVNRKVKQRKRNIGL